MAIENVIQGLDTIGFFSYIIPFFLSIAIVYGILETVNLPKSKAVRGTIAILSGFVALPLGPVIYPFLSRLELGLIVIAAGILALVIIAESIGLKAGDKKHIWEEHPKIASFILVIVGILVFASAGGLEFILPSGGGGFSLGTDMSIIIFLAVVLVGIWWITKDKK